MEAEREELVLLLARQCAECYFFVSLLGPGHLPGTLGDVEINWGPPNMVLPGCLPKGRIVKLRNMVEYPEVIADLETTVWLQVCNDGAGPGAGRLLDNTIM